MRRTKTMLMGDLLEEFQTLYIAAKKSPKANRRHMARDCRRPRRGCHHRIAARKHILYVRMQSSVLRSELFTSTGAQGGDKPPFGRVRLVNAVIIRETGFGKKAYLI